MNDLVDFLKTRLAEDRQRVLSVGPSKLGWGTYLHPDGGMGYTSPVASRGLSEDEWVTAGKVTRPDVVAVVFDPEIRLADIDAKLRIVNEHRIIDDRCRVCTAIHDGHARRFRAPCPTLRLLALPFADHRDYQEGWKP